MDSKSFYILGFKMKIFSKANLAIIAGAISAPTVVSAMSGQNTTTETALYAVGGGLLVWAAKLAGILPRSPNGLGAK